MQSPPRLFLDLKQPSDSKPPVVLHKTSWSQFSTYSFLKSLTEEHVEQLITRMVSCVMHMFLSTTAASSPCSFHNKCMRFCVSYSLFRESKLITNIMLEMMVKASSQAYGEGF